MELHSIIQAKITYMWYGNGIQIGKDVNTPRCFNISECKCKCGKWINTYTEQCECELKCHHKLGAERTFSIHIRMPHTA